MPTEQQLQAETRELLADIHFVNQVNKEQIRLCNQQIQKTLSDADLSDATAAAIGAEVSKQLGVLAGRIKLIEKATRSNKTGQLQKTSEPLAKINAQLRTSTTQFGAEKLAGGKNLLPLQSSETGIKYLWSGSDPEIRFTFSLDRTHVVGAQIRLFSLIKPEYSKQLKIFVDDIHIKHQFSVDQGLFVLSCDLPISSKALPTEIKIVLPATHSPSSLGISNDGRKLGLAITDIRFGKPESGINRLLKKLRLKK